MSRHRKIDYDEYDDYEDDYDYDYDEYDEDDATQYYEGASTVAPDTVDHSIDYVQFVMESLGELSINAQGKRQIKEIGLTEARVEQILKGYENNVEKTISYFTKSAISTTTVVKPVVAANSAASSNKAGGSSAAPASNKGNKASVTKSMTGGNNNDKTKVSTVFSGKITDSSEAVHSHNSRPYSMSDDDIETPVSVPSTDREHISMIVAGHVDAGKSTLVGNLLYKHGDIAQKTMHKYEKESKEIGKSSFAYAWIMDQNETEREHGVTIDIGEEEIRTATKNVTILDSPGHKDFVPNMISGCILADVGLLVIPASIGEFESSVGANAQTREHLTLLKALGVNQLIFAINKMDMTNPPWGKDRYDEIVHYVTTHILRDIKYNMQQVRFIPVSGITSENVVKISEACPLSQWYNGPTLLEGIDTFVVPKRQNQKSLRAVITGVPPSTGAGKSVDVNVAVIQGKLQVGRHVQLASKKCKPCAMVKKIIKAGGETRSTLFAGEKGVVTLNDQHGKTGEELNIFDGEVLCKGPVLVGSHRSFKASILTLATLFPPIIPGSLFILYIHGEEIQCCVSKIYNLVDPNEAESVVVKSPKCVPAGRTAHVKIRAVAPITVEPFQQCKPLGRFALRSKGATIAVGICTQTSAD